MKNYINCIFYYYFNIIIMFALNIFKITSILIASDETHYLLEIFN